MNIINEEWEGLTLNQTMFIQEERAQDKELATEEQINLNKITNIFFEAPCLWKDPLLFLNVNKKIKKILFYTIHY